jgi:hypothetical protein
MRNSVAVALLVAGGLTLSGMAYASGTTAAAAPTFKPAAGTYTAAQSVTIADTTPGAAVYYTTNGTAPTAASTRYTGAIAVSATETIEAIAVASGYSTSAVATAKYTITPPAATPVFSPPAGTYNGTQTVTIADATSGAAIYYTINGAAPTASSTRYTGALRVSASVVLKAIAMATGYSSSTVATASYTIPPPAATPAFKPAAGTYTSVQSVALADATSGAAIYYTTDGSTPTAGSSRYTAVIAVGATETLKAIATAAGYSSSAVATAGYTIDLPKYSLTVKSANPASGVSVIVTPNDATNSGSGTTGFTRTYTAGTAVTLTAPATANGNTFSAWTGCATASAETCNVTMSGNLTVTASYTTPVTPKTYYVSGTGNDSNNGLSKTTPFLTLQHAANLTQPGDTVYAMNGTYTNAYAGTNVLDINTAGTAENWITYAAYPGQAPKISFNGWAGIFVHATAAYIEINGFSIEGNNYNVTLQEALNQAPNSNPDPAFNGNCITMDGRAGTATQRVHHIKVLNNVVGACGGAGIGTGWADYITIANNIIYDSAWYSLYDGSAISTWENWNSDSYTGYKMFITGNRIYGNRNYVPWAPGDEFTDGEGIIVDSTRNSAYNPSSDSLAPYTGRTYIANNAIYTNGSSAIEVFESDHVDVVNNSSYEDIVSTILSGHGEMNLNQTSDVNVLNNIFYCSKGLNPVVVVPGTTSNILLDYNIYFGGTNLNIGNGAHDIVADPLYVSPTAASSAQRGAVLLSVQPGSPAIGSGTSNLAPATDFAGNPRPGSKGYDRGAYQQP